jgi:hypothetical protein
MNDLEQLRASSIGVQMATLAVLGALVKAHPDQHTLKAQLEIQRQHALVFLTNTPLQEQALEAFLASWDRVMVDTPSLPSIGG